VGTDCKEVLTGGVFHDLTVLGGFRQLVELFVNIVEVSDLNFSGTSANS